MAFDGSHRAAEPDPRYVASTTQAKFGAQQRHDCERNSPCSFAHRLWPRPARQAALAPGHRPARQGSVCRAGMVAARVENFTDTPRSVTCTPSGWMPIGRFFVIVEVKAS